MYLPNDYNTIAETWDWLGRLWEHVTAVLEILKQMFTGFSGSLPSALGFVLRWMHKMFNEPAEWMVELFYATVELVHTHIYLAHIIAWATFFGPIVILVPFLLVHELLILLAYNLIYTLHGLLPRTLPDQYEALRISLLDTRESLFSLVDRSSNVFNKWTAEHMPLMVLRLAGGVLGSILLYAIWVGW